MSEPTEEQMAQIQAQCPFCKMVRGDIPTTKVFEDEKVLAVMDIFPAANGHVLLIPKTHAAFIQLLPEEETRHLWRRAGEIGMILKETMIVPRVCMVSISGNAVGQRPLHAAIHLIPRDQGDGLDLLDPTPRVEQADTLALEGELSRTLAQIHAHLGIAPAQTTLAAPASPATPPERVAPEEKMIAHNDERAAKHETEGMIAHNNTGDASTTERPMQTEEFDNAHEALLTTLAMHPDLRRLIIAQPDLVTTYVEKSPKLKQLFAGVNIRALSLTLQRQEAEAAAARPAAQEPRAASMPAEELFAFIDGNEGLRTWMLEHPEELARGIGQNPRLAAFFAGIDIVDCAKRYRAWRQAKESRGASGTHDGGEA